MTVIGGGWPVTSGARWNGWCRPASGSACSNNGLSPWRRRADHEHRSACLRGPSSAIRPKSPGRSRLGERSNKGPPHVSAGSGIWPRPHHCAKPLPPFPMTHLTAADSFGNEPPSLRAVLRAPEAAAFCTVSLRHFQERIAPELPCIDLASPGSSRPMPRYLRADVQAWLSSHREGEK